jgi:hypothetical protein
LLFIEAHGASAPPTRQRDWDEENGVASNF